MQIWHMSTFKARHAPVASSGAAAVHLLGAASYLCWEEENEALPNCTKLLEVELEAETLRHQYLVLVLLGRLYQDGTTRSGQQLAVGGSLQLLSPVEGELLLLLPPLLSPFSSLELQMRPSCPNGLGQC